MNREAYILHDIELEGYTHEEVRFLSKFASYRLKGAVEIGDVIRFTSGGITIRKKVSNVVSSDSAEYDVFEFEID